MGRDKNKTESKEGKGGEGVPPPLHFLRRAIFFLSRPGQAQYMGQTPVRFVGIWEQSYSHQRIYHMETGILVLRS